MRVSTKARMNRLFTNGGCLDVAISADSVDPRRINSYERWESWDAIEAWRTRAGAPDTGITVHKADVTAFEVESSRPPF